MRTNVVEKKYRAYNAHAEPTTLRVRLDQHTGALEFWIGEPKGHDYPRLAKLPSSDVADLRRWLLELTKTA